MSLLSLIDGSTKLIGLLATPIKHSLAPALYNLAFQKTNINYTFMAFDVGTSQLKDAIKGFRALNLPGFQVSMPNKVKVISYLDGLSKEAQLIGAVNTIVNENGKLIGHNTDGYGFIKGLIDENVSIVGKKMTLLGAGGAATAIAIQAALDGVKEISIFNRKDELFKNAEKIAETINVSMKDNQCIANVYPLEDKKRLKKEIECSDIIANATGVGMKPYEGISLISEKSWFHPKHVVSDVIYAPRKTKLLELAESVGCKTINGQGMLLWQGAKAFELWTGKKMPIEYIKEKLFNN